MGFLGKLFGGGKAPKPKPAPTPAIKADSSILNAGQNADVGGFSSLISTTGSGLKRKAKTKKTSLIGG